MAFLLPSLPARCPGNGSTSRTSFVESTRHSKIHSCLPFFFFFLFFPLPFRLPRNEERERISFVKILHVRLICRDILSLARSLSAGFLIIHRLSLSLTQSPNCTLDYLFCCSLTVLDAALPINNLLTTIDSSLGVVSLAKKRETSFLMMNDQRTN